MHHVANKRQKQSSPCCYVDLGILYWRVRRGNGVSRASIGLGIEDSMAARLLARMDLLVVVVLFGSGGC